ncbi:type III-A CRISPR-associated protein Cas10/Csm1 [Staphylococcus debuckii]|uniref:type III-A CRISPR-associated protein Cas10/Csm1 n=1 Tax=Staphylococcus debuckii TaxID=2044912 RepID=UPI000F42EB51|nr:type III-A CRISPR-associated protein Cas10/Csm1 [Staphylococcus debuckii]AYU54482.1 type III-A CRISPR-associated protein Cas10/Csm1 [Staphylococcus debuckii]
MSRKLDLQYGSLLHDIGKIIYRSNSNEFEKGTHSKMGWEYLKKFEEFNHTSIKESVRYHHYKELSQVKLNNNSLAYITYIADNIASGADRRDFIEEGDEGDYSNSFKFDKFVPLNSIFNILNSQSLGISNGSLPFAVSEQVKYPKTTEIVYTSGNYTTLKNDMDIDLRERLKFEPKHFSSLLQWTESLWSTIPSSTNLNQLVDVSLYDHSKVTCAVACCIYDYLESYNINNYKEELFSPYSKTKDFYDKPVFLLASLDMSGIQDFIFNISGSKALKSLRARSFYLEIILEVIVDQLLGKLELSRANLLYTGGGHAYLLLPNTNSTKEIIQDFDESLRKWFINMFSTDLSVAIAYQECTGNDLMNSNNQYRQIWQSVSQKLSDKKAHKYSAEDILRMNQTKSYGERECKECLRSDLELNEEGICPICDGIIKISNNLRDNDFFVVGDNGKLSLPFDLKLKVVNREEVEKLLNSHTDIKIYSKNKAFIGPEVTTNLWMCDYDLASTNEETKKEGISSYVEREIGIRRLGVVRADIDNLGAAFINGIPEKYNSLSRTATFSRNLSMFFKYELNNLLEGSKITVIYSGGDDIFLIGAWDDVISKTIEVRNAFEKFTLNKLTFSAGIGIYPSKYPVSKMASETGELEEAAKQGEKNQVALWNKHKVYKWNTLEKDILNDKLEIISGAFETTADHGKAFIYKIIELLREDSQINIARLAYLLARSNINSHYSNIIFKWSRSEEDREQLITAFEYYVYQTREG